MKILVLITILTCSLNSSWAQALKKNKTTVKYKEHTQFDFAGDRVDGKLKGAQVFYIFQRKRSQGHFVITPPEKFNYNYARTRTTLRKSY